MEKHRKLLLELALEALAAVRGDSLVEQAAKSLSVSGSVEVVALGKAACAMYRGACRYWGSAISRALIVSKLPCARGETSGDSVRTLCGDHPLPGANSLRCGDALLAWLKDSAPPSHLVFLISGGTSSLVEVPLAGIEPSDLRAINQWLLGSGWDIARINALRIRLSRIKGGGLLDYIDKRSVNAWLLSDVAGDDPAVIGSGLLFPGTLPDLPLDDLPSELRARVKASAPREPVRAAPEVHVRILGNLHSACRSLVAAAERRGLTAYTHDTDIEGCAEAAGHGIATQLLDAPSGIHIWGGETTVRLPESPGRGGRNQHLALAAARVLRECHDILLLALATDGGDGPGEDAGALVDGGTLARGATEGFCAEQALRHADSGGFLEASGDLISTGETGTNVRDLIIALKREP